MKGEQGKDGGENGCFLGLEIGMADSTFLTHGRTRVQRNEGVEIIVSVKNERNLAALTVYGDIEGQEPSHAASSFNEIYITAGVVSLFDNFFSIPSCSSLILAKSLLEK